MERVAWQARQHLEVKIITKPKRWNCKKRALRKHNAREFCSNSFTTGADIGLHKKCKLHSPKSPVSTDRGPPAAMTSKAAAPSLRLPASDKGVCKNHLSVSTQAMIGPFCGPYSIVRPDTPVSLKSFSRRRFWGKDRNLEYFAWQARGLSRILNNINVVVWRQVK